jgi:3'-phosphoadenosine 5'-phosphosulfate sulfotransferase (PAPS reductase)/FAD synthetase
MENQNKVRHVLGISGGKDSAALAIYMKNKYPNLDIDYYTCDTGKELKETYDLIEKLEGYLGKEIIKLRAAEQSLTNPFDHLLTIKGNYLPSHFSRWCTKEMKLKPFEDWVGDRPTVSYVGIRGDEDREGYISTKSNIQSIFPFRKNLWSVDVITKALSNNNRSKLAEFYAQEATPHKLDRTVEIANEPLSISFPQDKKLQMLMDLDTKAFNRVIFKFLKSTNYPLSKVDAYPVLDNDDNLIRQDIFDLLGESGVGVPSYYEKIEYTVDGQIGYYARSRSGCYFCFFQQKIEWVWLLEQHPQLFQLAIDYEKEGYNWIQDEPLTDLMKPERVEAIKREHLKRMNRNKANTKSPFLTDILDEEEAVGCAACFI